MNFISEYKKSEELLNSFDKEMTLEFFKRREEYNYNTPFDSLKGLQLVRSLTIIRAELLTNYINLHDQEPLDEN